MGVGCWGLVVGGWLLFFGGGIGELVVGWWLLVVRWGLEVEAERSGFPQRAQRGAGGDFVADKGYARGKLAGYGVTRE